MYTPVYFPFAMIFTRGLVVAFSSGFVDYVRGLESMDAIVPESSLCHFQTAVILENTSTRWSYYLISAVHQMYHGCVGSHVCIRARRPLQNINYYGNEANIIPEQHGTTSPQKCRE